jgi:hypothetical protein
MFKSWRKDAQEMKMFLFIISIFILTGCANNYSKFYTQQVDPKTLINVQFLDTSQEPRIIRTNNINRDVRSLMAKMYIPFGHSSFNGGYEDDVKLISFAKELRASIVIQSVQYSETQTSVVPFMMPNTNTTQMSGLVRSGNNYGTYSGTATSYGSAVVPLTSHQRRYNQEAVFLVRSLEKPRIGFIMRDLNEVERKQMQRNQGVYVDIIIEDSPAFKSNLLEGDIIIEASSVIVKNTPHILQLIQEIPPSTKAFNLLIIRNGTEKSLQIML